MFFKRKHLLVTVFSSAIIAVVFLSTLVVYSLYLQWKKDILELRYRKSIYKLTAELFRRDVSIYNVNVRIRGTGVLPDTPVIEGSLKNNSGKTITSILIELSFSEPNGTVLYHDWFHPLGEKHFGSPPLSSRPQPGAKKVLSPGESISFTYLLKNCPPDVMEQIERKTRFAKSSSAGIKMTYSITGMSVL